MNSGTVVSREMLARHVWKATVRHTSMDNVTDVHIAHIRRKIAAPSAAVRSPRSQRESANGAYLPVVLTLRPR